MKLDKTTSVLSFLDGFIQNMLWAVLCFSVIKSFQLENIWFIVCGGVLCIQIGLLVLHQKVTFPRLVIALGYEPNDSLEEIKKVHISDHLISIFVLFGIVYLCVI